mmetsp:Transcript_28212/g.67095  ORF Transcript_28212/g.67095 Transcript_28212/m.67095 type:complete len:160 (+) Transcript_28212:1307-1786(+)
MLQAGDSKLSARQSWPLRYAGRQLILRKFGKPLVTLSIQAVSNTFGRLSEVAVQCPGKVLLYRSELQLDTSCSKMQRSRRAVLLPISLAKQKTKDSVWQTSESSRDCSMPGLWPLGFCVGKTALDFSTALNSSIWHPALDGQCAVLSVCVQCKTLRAEG